VVSKNSPSIARAIKSVRFVKTILSLEESIDLVDFYYPVKVEIPRSTGSPKSKKLSSRVVSELRDLPGEGGTLIIGTVGQGKSIFLRYLTACEAAKGRCIPVFVELRKLDDKLSVSDLVIKELRVYGINVNEEEFDVMCKYGFLVMFFDGFDEVSPPQRKSVLSQIENLIRIFKDLTVVMSSRPNFGAEWSSCFRVFRLGDLESGEYVKVIDNLIKDDDQKNSLIKALENTPIASMLTTRFDGGAFQD
jgi:predicted NACHT family NTPase